MLVLKYLVSAAIVVAVSEIAKHSGRGGAFLASLPLVSIMVLIWLYAERQPTERVAAHAYYTFWYVLPTLPMFLAFPWLLPRLGFWPTLLLCVVITVLCFGLMVAAVKPFGVDLISLPDRDLGG